MAPMAAALAVSQLSRLDERNARRNENCIYLSKQLETLGIETFLAPEGIDRVYFEFLVRYDETKTGLPINDLNKSVTNRGRDG